MSRLPDMVACGGCKRRLDPRVYQASPEKDTPREQVTEVSAPTFPRFSVHCSTCGHYTVFVGQGPKKFD